MKHLSIYLSIPFQTGITDHLTTQGSSDTQQGLHMVFVYTTKWPSSDKSSLIHHRSIEVMIPAQLSSNQLLRYSTIFTANDKKCNTKQIGLRQ